MRPMIHSKHLYVDYKYRFLHSNLIRPISIIYFYVIFIFYDYDVMNSWCSVSNIGRNTMYSMYMNICVNKDWMADDDE